MSVLSPAGTAKERFLAARERRGIGRPSRPTSGTLAYLGWEIGRCAEGLDTASRRALEALAAACVASMRAGSTRVPLDADASAQRWPSSPARTRCPRSARSSPAHAPETRRRRPSSAAPATARR